MEPDAMGEHSKADDIKIDPITISFVMAVIAVFDSIFVHCENGDIWKPWRMFSHDMFFTHRWYS